MILTGGNPIVFPVAEVNNAWVPVFSIAETGGTNPEAGYQMGILSSTDSGVLNGYLAFGYNARQKALPGETALYIQWQANTESNSIQYAEWLVVAQFPDGTQTLPADLYVRRDNTHSMLWNFTFGAAAGDNFAIFGANNTVEYFVLSAAVGGATFYQPNLNLDCSATASRPTFSLNAPTANPTAQLLFAVAGAAKWEFYVGANFQIYDSVNSVQILEFLPAAAPNGKITAGGVFYPVQAITASAPSYVKGGVYFDTTLNKLRIGGASAWETVTSA